MDDLAVEADFSAVGIATPDDVAELARRLAERGGRKATVAEYLRTLSLAFAETYSDARDALIALGKRWLMASSKV